MHTRPIPAAVGHVFSAEWVAHQLHWDGHRLTDDNGRHVLTVCNDREPVSRTNGRTGTKVTFWDASILLVDATEWDFGYADCWCRQNEGHTAQCEAQDGAQ